VEREQTRKGNRLELPNQSPKEKKEEKSIGNRREKKVVTRSNPGLRQGLQEVTPGSRELRIKNEGGEGGANSERSVSEKKKKKWGRLTQPPLNRSKC